MEEIFKENILKTKWFVQIQTLRTARNTQNNSCLILFILFYLLKCSLKMLSYRLGKVNDLKSYASQLFDKQILYNFNMCTV